MTQKNQTFIQSKSHREYEKALEVVLHQPPNSLQAHLDLKKNLSLPEFHSLLNIMLFLKPVSNLAELDRAFKARAFSNKLTPSEHQDCLVDTAF